MAEEDKKALDFVSEISKSLSPAYECSSDVVMNTAEEEKKALDSGSEISKSLSPTYKCSSDVVMNAAEEEKKALDSVSEMWKKSREKFLRGKRLLEEREEYMLRTRRPHFKPPHKHMTDFQIVRMNRSPSCMICTPTATGDFTNGEILRNKRPHYVVFKPRTVNESYEKFLNYRKERAILREKNLERVQERRREMQERRGEMQLLRQLGKLSL